MTQDKFQAQKCKFLMGTEQACWFFFRKMENTEDGRGIVRFGFSLLFEK